MPNGLETVYVGRPSKWGNPFKVHLFGRDVAIQKYEAYLKHSHILKDIKELKYKVLLCHCFPAKCHASILVKYAYE